MQNENNFFPRAVFKSKVKILAIILPKTILLYFLKPPFIGCKVLEDSSLSNLNYRTAAYLLKLPHLKRM
jgi:hypothetical protein